MDATRHKPCSALAEGAQGFPLSEAEARSLMQTPEAKEHSLQQLLAQQVSQNHRSLAPESSCGSVGVPEDNLEGREQVRVFWGHG